MLIKNKTIAAVAVALLLSISPAVAQRGGSRGGGGAERGGSGGSRSAGAGGGAQRGGGGAGAQHSAGGSNHEGGFGGGLSSSSRSHAAPTSGASMGAYNHTASGSHAGQSAGGTKGRPGAGGAGGPDSGVGVRPGAGAGAAGVGVRPGKGGAGGPDSGVGVRPGAGAGAAGVGVRPGAGVGAPGTTGAQNAYAARYSTGTHYTTATASATHVSSFHAAAGAYPAYSPAKYGAYPNAWPPKNLTNASVYANPGYRTVATQVGLNATPVPYDYGGNVVVQPTAVYVNGDGAGTPQEYANQAGQLASAGQSAPPDQDAKWTPLGVFAIVEGEQTSSDDTFQLTVNSQGVIRGNYHNLKTDEVVSLSGSVDKATQRAAWTIGTDQVPVYEAGIANLTRDSAPLLVHLGDGQTHQVTLIRLRQPSQ